VTVYTAGNDSILQVTFTQLATDPMTGNTVDQSQWHCEGSSCSGITLGPVTENDDAIGSPILIRSITFDHTPLAGLNADGTATNTVATLTASFTTVYYDGALEPFTWPMLMPCAATADTVAVSVTQGGPFNFCSTGPRSATVDTDGDIELSLPDDNFFGASLTVRLHGSQVAAVTYNNLGNLNVVYLCTTDCAGVSVSNDSSGNYVVTFNGTILHVKLDYDIPGPNTQTLTGGPLVFGPPQ
jgi:hypothetical protein